MVKALFSVLHFMSPIQPKVAWFVHPLAVSWQKGEGRNFNLGTKKLIEQKTQCNQPAEDISGRKMIAQLVSSLV